MNDVIRDGDTYVTRCGDDATLANKLFNVGPARAFSNDGVDVARPINNTISLGRSSKMVLASPEETNKTRVTDGDRAQTDEVLDKVDSASMINGNFKSFNIGDVNDSFMRKFSSTLKGIGDFGDDEKSLRTRSRVEAGIVFNRHGDDDSTVMSAKIYSDGRELSSD